MFRALHTDRTVAGCVLVAAAVVALVLLPAAAVATPGSLHDGGDPLSNVTNDTAGDGSLDDGGESDDESADGPTDGTVDGDTDLGGDGSANDTTDGTTDDVTETDGTASDGTTDGGTDDGTETDGTASGDDLVADVVENGSTSLDGSVSLGAGNETVLDATLETTVDGDGATVGLEATSVGGLSLSTNTTLDANGSRGPATGGSGGDGENGSDGGGPAGTGGDGTSGSDGGSAGDAAGEGGGASSLPDPEEAGAGLAIGSLLLGGGLLARRFVETSALTAGGGGAGGSLFAAAAAWLRAWGWRVLALFGYQRLDSSDPLEHETRAAIYERIEDAPGVFLTELSEQSDVPMSTLRYHLRILEFEDLIGSEKVRGKRRYFPAEAEPDALDPALEEEATAAVLEAVAREPDSVSGLAERLDRDPSTVTHHLQRLDDEGLVEREREGRSVVTRLADGIDRTDVAAATAGHAD